jgi:phage pi2 protein 07
MCNMMRSWIFLVDKNLFWEVHSYRFELVALHDVKEKSAIVHRQIISQLSNKSFHLYLL